MSTRWKVFERQCAVLMGGRRRPVTGLDRGDGDVFTPMFEIQCKSRTGQPAYVKRWLAEICATAARRDRIGVIVWKEPIQGHQIGDALVIMRFSDFVDLHGTPEAVIDAEEKS